METTQFISSKSHKVTIAVPEEDIKHHSTELIKILLLLNNNTEIILNRPISECYKDYLHNEQQAYYQVITCIRQNVWEAYFALPLLVVIETKAIEHIEPLRNHGLITGETFDNRKQFFGDLALLKEKTKSIRADLKPITKEWKKIYSE